MISPWSLPVSATTQAASGTPVTAMPPVVAGSVSFFTPHVVASGAGSGLLSPWSEAVSATTLPWGALSTVHGAVSITVPTVAAEENKKHYLLPIAFSASSRSVLIDSVATSDLLVVFGFCEDSTASLVVSTAGDVVTWTEQQSYSATGKASLWVWTGTVASNQASVSVTVTPTKSAYFGASVYKITQHGGIGNSAIGSGDSSALPAVTLTSTNSNSSILCLNVDWNGIQGDPVWRSLNGVVPRQIFADSEQSRAYGASYYNIGDVGSKTVGVNSPSGQSWTLAALEVKGVGGSTSTDALVEAPVGTASSRGYKPLVITNVLISVTPTTIDSAVSVVLSVTLPSEIQVPVGTASARGYSPTIVAIGPAGDALLNVPPGTAHAASGHHYVEGIIGVSAEIEVVTGVTTASGIPVVVSGSSTPQPQYTEDQYKQFFLAAHTRITRRVRILNSDASTLWENTATGSERLIAGSISVDYSRDERRSADLELANFDDVLAHRPGGFWYDKYLEVWRGIEFYDVSGLRSYEVPVGLFMIDRVVEARFPKTVKITARDFTKKCLLSKFTSATEFTSTQAVEDVIKAIAGAAGITRRIIPVTGATLGVNYVFERGKTRWEAMKEIATAFGYELFFDASGVLVMREFLDPTLGAVSHTFTTGPETGNLIDWSLSANDTRIFNVVPVVGAETDGTPIWAVATNTNASSPTNTTLLGERVMDPYESSLITTTDQAQQLANSLLKVSALEEFEINMSSLVFPWLEAGEIVKFNPPESDPNDPEKFLLTSLTIPVGLEPMTAVGRRVMMVG